MLAKLLFVAAGCALVTGAANAQTMANATKGTPEQRAGAVLAEMTPEEKLTLVKGYFGSDFGTTFTAPAEARPGSAGYVPGIPRLGIPPQWETDAGMGVATQGGAKSKRPATALPSGLAVAASWDADIAYAGGRMIGAEARAYGFNVILAGGVDLVREPRNGRNFEYAGEDPLLAGTIAGAAISGIQSNHIVSTVKHYAVNDQETDRGKINAVIDEAAARTSDLLAFQLAIEGGDPGSVMCAYNRVNGPYACESKHLLTDVLRTDWHYQGYVMSDWGAAHSTLDAVNAGLDQESGLGLHRDDNYGAKLAEAVASGAVSGAQLDAMAGHVLTAMFAHGLIDDPVAQPTAPDFAAGQDVARKAEEAGAVLLKNDGGLLPLIGARHIAVIGGHADKGVLSGAGSSQVYSGDGPGGGNAVPGLTPTSWPGPVFYYPSSPLDELRKALPGATIDYADGSDPAAAARLAKGADVAIVFATQWTGESKDFSLTLPDNQDALIAAVAAANANTAVVLETGGPVLMPWNGKVKAVLEAWYPGRMGGLAIANLLTGKANPSGALPVTFPASLAQLPHPADPPMGTVDYTEGAAVGYKWFDKQREQPLYAFGHGLSYTTFKIGDLNVFRNAKGALVATVSLTNTGQRAGAKAVQLYAAHANAGDGGWEAPRRLAGFHKFALAPGESQTARIEIDPRLLATWANQPGAWLIDRGVYAFSASLSSDTPATTRDFQMAVAKYLPADWQPGDKH